MRPDTRDPARLEEYRRHLHRRLEESHVPERLHDGLTEYIVARRPMGAFLTAIVSNDLAEACARADGDNKPHICDVALFLYNYAPAHCWGFPERVQAWLAAEYPPPMVFE